MRTLALAARLLIAVPAVVAVPVVQAVPAHAQLRIIGGPQPGRKAPEFTLPAATQAGVADSTRPFELWKTVGQVVVIAFYPRDFTATGTLQWKLFAERRDSLFGSGTTVVGISPDSVTTHARFAKELALPFPLLADLTGAVARRYGAVASDGEFRRAVYVLRKDGRVHFRDMQFDPRNERSLAALRTAVQEAIREVKTP